MKKIFGLIIIAILIVEVILFLRLTNLNRGNQKQTSLLGNEEDINNRISVALSQCETLKKDNENLKKASDTVTKTLQAKEQELQEAIKANEILQTGVTAKFEELLKKATQSDNQRKIEITDLNKKIDAANNEKTALAAKLDEELKKRDATIAQLNKTMELNDKILSEERQRTADLTKQLEEEKGKVKVLTDQTLTAKTELDAEKKKNEGIAAENELLKKKIEELTKKP